MILFSKKVMMVNAHTVGKEESYVIWKHSKTQEKNIELFCNQKESKNFVDENVKIEKFERTVGWKALK